MCPQRYRFTFCPFRHVTQVEINHTQWRFLKRAKQGLPLHANEEIAAATTVDVNLVVDTDGRVQESKFGAPHSQSL